MKKVMLLTVLILIVVFSFGCGKNGRDNPDNPQISKEPVREPVIHKKTIGTKGEASEREIINYTFDYNTIPAFSQGWSQTAVYSVDSKSATDDGSGSMKFMADPNLEGGGLTHWFEYNFDVYKGCTYSVSFSYAGKSGGKFAKSYYCGVTNRSNDHDTITKGEYDKALVGKWNIDWDNLKDGNFLKAPEIVFTAGETTTYSVFFQLYGMNKKGTFWIDDIKVVEKQSNNECVITFDGGEYEDKYVFEIFGNRNVTEVPEAPEVEGKIFGGWYDEKGYLYDYTEVYSGKNTFKPVYFSKEVYDTFLSSFNLQDEIPSVIINTDGKRAISSKRDYIGAKITIESKNPQYCINDVHLNIRGRGNSSWYCMEKQSFRLKLDEKAKILGMSKDRNYALISNHDDKSLMRNFLAYGFASSRDNLSWTPECHYVNLTLNGDFRGLYLLIETVREDNNRVNLEGTPSESRDKGFLVEQVPEGRMNDELSADPSEVFVYAGGYYWNVKYPEREDFSSEEEFKLEKRYIKTCIEDGFEALYKKDFEILKERWDVDAFLDFWLLEELFANFDSFQASVFLYKPMGGKLTFGPAWDYDIGANNIGYVNIKPNKWYLGSNKDTIFGKAMRIEEFRKMAFDKIKDYYENEWMFLICAVDEVGSNIETEWYHNYERWDYKEKVFETPPWILELKGYPEQQNYIKIWLNRHMVFLYNEAMAGKAIS